MAESDAITTEQIARECFAWANGDASKLDALAPDIDVRNPGLPDGAVRGRERWNRYLDEVRRGFPDLRFAIEELVADDDVAMVEAQVSGTHEGEFKGIRPTGRRIEFRLMTKLVVEDGRVTTWNEYYDTQEPPAQLGVTFPAVIGQLPKLAWGKLRATR